MNILVIGNGFDLAHGLSTKYGDFIEFISEFKEDKVSLSKRLKYNATFDQLNEPTMKTLLDEFELLVANNIWVNHFQQQDNLLNKGWIDFECEISNVIQSLEYWKFYLEESRKNHELPDFDKDTIKEQVAIKFLRLMGNDAWKDFQGEQAKKIIDGLYMELNDLIRALEIYLYFIVRDLDTSKRVKDISKICYIDKVVCFNYTNTYERVYTLKSKSVDYDYVHGRINTIEIEENNMVLGIDEYLNDDTKDKKLDFIKFKKYFQRIYKKTGCKYKSWLEELGNVINNVYIYGHSLDVTDKDILVDLIMFPYSKTTIFYYNESDYEQKITNMVKLIGQDKVIKGVYGKNPSIVFQKVTS